MPGENGLRSMMRSFSMKLDSINFTPFKDKSVAFMIPEELFLMEMKSMAGLG
jgi:hypothetical protein